MTTPHTAAADPAEIAKFDDLAHRFWDEHGEFRPLHRLNPVRAGYIAGRATLAGARVLDVGCGGGLLAESLKRLGAQVMAIDLAPAMIETARLHATESALDIDYRVLDANELARDPAARFDVVCCMEMLEHVPSPEAMLATLGALLKPGGSLFISTLNRNLRSFLTAIVGAEYVLRLLPRGTHEYERFIRPSELATWARGCQLDLRHLAGIAWDPLRDRAAQTEDVSVNYMAHLSRRSSQT